MREASERELSYFGLQVYWGVSKGHMGGLKSTDELIELCRIDEDKHVLDVGCGFGITSCYIARKHGCRVVGVDITEEMINKAKERAKREGVQDRVEFGIGDAQTLPFKDDFFDIVISESVIAFLVDKAKGINEYVRVAKPGGYVGINEGTWIRAHPPAEFAKYVSRIAGAKFETPNNWRRLLEPSGLKNVEVKIHKPRAVSLFINEIRYSGITAIIRGLPKFLSLFRSSAFRRYVKEAWPSMSVFKGYKYLGYGIYVGRKWTD